MVEVAVLEEVAEIFASLRDVETAFARFLTLAQRIGGTDRSALYLRDDDRGVFYRWKNRPDMVDLEVPSAAVDAMYAESNQTLVPFDAPIVADKEPIIEARAAGLHYALGFALRHGTTLVGALTLAYPQLPRLPESSLRVLHAVARFPAAAIEHTRLQATAQRRAHLADALRRFGERALVETSEPTLHQLILDATVALTGSDQASITHVTGDRVKVVAGIGKDATFVGLEAPVDALKEALSTEAPYVVGDVSRADSSTLLVKLARRNGAASFMAMPLRHHDRVLGHLFAGSARPHHYYPDVIEAMRILGSMAASVIEQRRAQAAATSEAGRLAGAIEHLPIVIEVFDHAGARIQSNASARALRIRLGAPDGTAQDPLPGVTMRTLEGVTVPLELTACAQALRGVRTPPREVVAVDMQGQPLTLLVAAAPLFAADGTTVESVVLGCQDVSKLHELAQAKDRFLRIAAHELRSPITALHATAQLFDLDPAVATDAARRAALLARVTRQTDRLRRLVEQLLDSVRLNAGELPLQRVPVDLVELCHDVAEMTLPAEGPRAVFDTEGPVIGSWDATRIEQVLTNLLSNAARYSGPGTQVTISVRSDGQRAILRVADQGIGIPAHQLDQLFRPFFRAANAGERHGGLGLGLHIAQEIVRRHGGDIRVESEESRGTTFTVELPLE